MSNIYFNKSYFNIKFKKDIHTISLDEHVCRFFNILNLLFSNETNIGHYESKTHEEGYNKLTEKFSEIVDFVEPNDKFLFHKIFSNNLLTDLFINRFSVIFNDLPNIINQPSNQKMNFEKHSLIKYYFDNKEKYIKEFKLEKNNLSYRFYSMLYLALLYEPSLSNLNVKNYNLLSSDLKNFFCNLLNCMSFFEDLRLTEIYLKNIKFHAKNVINTSLPTKTEIKNLYSVFDNKYLFSQTEFLKLKNVNLYNLDFANLTPVYENIDFYDFLKTDIKSVFVSSKNLTTKDIKAYLRNVMLPDQSKIEKEQEQKLNNEDIKDIKDSVNPDDIKIQLQQDIKEKLKKINNSSIKSIVNIQIVNMDSFDNRSASGYSYCQRFLDLPISNYQKINLNIKKIKEALDKRIYGMNQTKDQILKILNIVRIKNDSHLPVICIHGKPGVGKTKFVRELTDILNLKLHKISLNSISDIDTLCGSPSVYIGANHGLFSDAFIKTGCNNPVILLDEIDKINTNTTHRGNISNVLLSVLDNTQNDKFREEYFGFELDFSKVLFIATANDIKNINPILADRMQFVEVEDYSENDKLILANNFLLPSLYKNNGIKNLNISSDLLKIIINKYTNEAGLRSLEHLLDNLIKTYLYEKTIGNNFELNLENVSKIKSPIIFENIQHNKSGIVNGLYVDGSGGGLMKVESIFLDNPNNDNICFEGLGLLGKSSVNSIKILTYCLEFNLTSFNINRNELLNKKILYNFKTTTEVDGHSAGITLLTAVVSKLKNKIISNEIAMTGAIDLNGNILAIGGLKSKIIGAIRENIKIIYAPKQNEGEILMLSKDIKEKVNIILVDNIIELFNYLELI